jgi:replication initiation and membrane attachment protein DnaB
LPPNYRIKQPLEPLNFDDDPMLNKKIKKEEKFRYKPLNEYRWKPGFEEISSSSE